jgi:hypothetical protein
MRSLVFATLLSSASAFAQTAPTPAPTPSPTPTAVPVRGNGLSLVVIDELPTKCRDLGKLADSPSQNQALSARISLASCIVEQKLKDIVLCDCEQSVREIETASELSFKLLDEVSQVGDPATKILALQAQGDMLSSLATRVLSTVPPAADASESAVALHDMRLALITPHVSPWQQRARSAYQELDRIARANPQLAKNQAVVAAVRTSRAKLSAMTSPSATATR